MLKPSLSIITATYNAEKFLPALIESLRRQSDKNFEWVVADGASTDSTLTLLKDVTDLNLVLSSQKDFGIYDALNRAINLCKAEHYLVLGADDQLSCDTVLTINNYLNKNETLDLIIGQVIYNGNLIKIRKGLKFLFGARAYVASHSVGCVFRKKLHETFGMYSNKYPLLADTYFIKMIFTDPTLKAIYSPVVFGTFSSSGVSSNNILRVQCEFAHIQITTEDYKFFQLMIAYLRLAIGLFRKNNP